MMEIIETSNDTTLSIQAVTPTISDVEQPNEICLLIENATNNQVVTMTVPQAYRLIKALKKIIRCNIHSTSE